MYRIMASKGRKSAILEKDGEFYGSIGPERIYRLSEKDLRPISKISLEEAIKGDFIPHDPPTEIERFEDWPDAAVAYEARLQTTAPHAAD